MTFNMRGIGQRRFSTHRWRALVVMCVGLTVVPVCRGEEQGEPDTQKAPKPHPTVQSENPFAYLNDASILFYKGIDLLQSGHRVEAETVFRTIETELLQAMRLSEPNQTNADIKELRSQCAFLLGELQLYVWNDTKKAKGFYEEALRYFPQHDGAIRALASVVFPEVPQRQEGTSQ